MGWECVQVGRVFAVVTHIQAWGLQVLFTVMLEQDNNKVH